MKRPAIFFDRDNTLIANDGYLGDPAGVALIEGAADAIARVRDMGFTVVTFSNQSGVARGLFTEEAVHAVNARLDELLQDQNDRAVIGRHEFCPFHPEAAIDKYRQESDLRKPRPGMILQAAERLDLDLARSWVIGDAPRDIEAGKAAGCRTILFADPALAASPAAGETSSAAPDFSASSLKRAVDLIARETLGVPLPEESLPPAAEPTPEPETASSSTQVAAVESTPGPQEKASQESAPAAPPAIAAVAEAVPSPAPTSVQADAVVAASEPKPAEAKAAAGPAIRRPRKPTFAERVKSGTFVPASKRAMARPVAEAAETGESAEPATAVAVKEAAPSADAVAATIASETPVAQPAEPAVEAPAAPVAAPAVAARSRPVPRSTLAATEESERKVTFAQRVKSGAFKAERSSDGDGGAAVEKPGRRLATTGEGSAAQVGRVVESLTSPPPRLTDPVSPAEDLGPILQTILEEIRLMREEKPPADFSISKLLAGIVQVLVLPALFMAWLHRDAPADAQSLLLVAIFLQTLVIALSVMGRQS